MKGLQQPCYPQSGPPCLGTQLLKSPLSVIHLVRYILKYIRTIRSYLTYRRCTCAHYISIFALASPCWNYFQDYHIRNAEGVLPIEAMN